MRIVPEVGNETIIPLNDTTHAAIPVEMLCGIEIVNDAGVSIVRGMLHPIGDGGVIARLRCRSAISVVLLRGDVHERLAQLLARLIADETPVPSAHPTWGQTITLVGIGLLIERALRSKPQPSAPVTVDEPVSVEEVAR